MENNIRTYASVHPSQTCLHANGHRATRDDVRICPPSCPLSSCSLCPRAWDPTKVPLARYDRHLLLYLPPHGAPISTYASPIFPVLLVRVVTRAMPNSTPILSPARRRLPLALRRRSSYQLVEDLPPHAVPALFQHHHRILRTSHPDDQRSYPTSPIPDYMKYVSE